MPHYAEFHLGLHYLPKYRSVPLLRADWGPQISFAIYGGRALTSSEKKSKKNIFFSFFFLILGAKAETSLSCPENLHTLVSVLQCILCFQRITFLSQLYLSQCGWGIPFSGEVLGLFKFQ